jgi:hypothetical protein
MEDFAVTCPLVPGVPPLVSGSCASPRTFGLGFLQTAPRDGALALLLAFGSAYTWHGDFHPVSSVPCLAHTLRLSRAAEPRRLEAFVRRRPQQAVGRTRNARLNPKFAGTCAGYTVRTSGRGLFPVHLFPYAVNTKSFAFAIVWHEAPHLATVPSGAKLSEARS